MGRKPRVHFAGAVYHAIVRGNNRQAIFRDQGDYSKFEDLVEVGLKNFSHQIHAYCWMTNHAHMLVKVAEVSLSEILHNLCFRYAGWFNRRYSRTGHLFERRFLAGLIHTEESIRRVVQYIHLNPVRAGIVSKPSEYRWSSHAHLLGLSRNRWLSRSLVQEIFEDSSMDLETYILQGLQEEFEGQFSKEVADLLDLHSPGEDEIEPRLGAAVAPPVPTWRLARPPEVLQAVAESEGIEISDLIGGSQRKEISHARAIVSYLGSQCSDLSNADIARHLHCDPSTVSRGAARVDRRLIRDEDLRRRLEQITLCLAANVRQQRKGSAN